MVKDDTEHHEMMYEVVKENDTWFDSFQDEKEEKEEKEEYIGSTTRIFESGSTHDII